MVVVGFGGGFVGSARCVSWLAVVGVVVVSWEGGRGCGV